MRRDLALFDWDPAKVSHQPEQREVNAMRRRTASYS
jgi:hypothetical protein